MQNPEHNPWLIHLVWKLLHNDKDALKLIKQNPFPDSPPNYIRIDFYKYEFEKPWHENVWKRTYIGTWLPALSKDNPQLQEFIKANGWNMYG